ncbi:MAG: YiiX/YebB-like N1pC/P60 family cysteine hydrolase [Candidatus Thorarchaeota archaeon]
MRSGLSRLLAISLAAMMLALVAAPVPVAASSGSSSGTNDLDWHGLLPGDIILVSNPGSLTDGLIPGQFQHAALYCGLVKPFEKIWDCYGEKWMDAGTPYVIQATLKGFGYDTFEHAVNNAYEDVVVLRVLNKDGSALTSSQRASVITYLKSQLSGGPDGYPVGPDYDFYVGVINKPGESSADHGFYCSEAVWAGYHHALGIDLDSNFVKEITVPLWLRIVLCAAPGVSVSPVMHYFGVAPDDLLHSQYTSVVAGEVGSERWNPSPSQYRVTTYVEKVYFNDDYDGGLAGPGEIYLITKTGDYDYPTEKAFPGSGKIGDAPDVVYVRDGPGYVTFSATSYALVGYNRDVVVNVQAWEHDTLSNTAYPSMRMEFDTSVWHAYVGTGWHYFIRHTSDCTYYIKVRFDLLGDNPASGGTGGGGGGGSGGGGDTTVGPPALSP